MITVQPMPTYEYRCEACSHELEAFQSIKDARLTDCPKCGRPKLERLISATAFQLKGSGWYKDLYSSPNNGKKSAA
jgi:putative FmdB family regulatory protein